MVNNENIKKTFNVFSDNYELVPLEVFGDDPYRTLVSTLMSSRTKDETTLEASKRLFKQAPTVSALNGLTEKQIRKLIYPVGFYKTKAKHLKQLTHQLLENHDGIVPKTRKELTALPGVGIKTANLVLNRAFGVPAIAVDTHLHRIVNVLGWVNTKSPEQTEKKLIEIIPKEYWSDMNRLFVSIGREYTTNKKLEPFLKKHNLL